MGAPRGADRNGRRMPPGPRRKGLPCVGRSPPLWPGSCLARRPRALRTTRCRAPDRDNRGPRHRAVLRHVTVVHSREPPGRCPPLVSRRPGSASWPAEHRVHVAALRRSAAGAVSSTVVEARQRARARERRDRSERGAFPVIVFSHGATNDPVDFAYTLERIAAEGFIVAAPYHTGNTQDEVRRDYVNGRAGATVFPCLDGRARRPPRRAGRRRCLASATAATRPRPAIRRRRRRPAPTRMATATSTRPSTRTGRTAQSSTSTPPRSISGRSRSSPSRPRRSRRTTPRVSSARRRRSRTRSTSRRS